MASDEIPQFRSFLNTIAGELINEELKTLKYLCLSHLTKARLERVSTPLELFVAIAEVITEEEDQLKFLEQLLFDINRIDLKSMVEEFQRKRAQVRQPDNTHNPFGIGGRFQPQQTENRFSSHNTGVPFSQQVEFPPPDDNDDVGASFGRMSVVASVERGAIEETDAPSQSAARPEVFISYQWDLQDTVRVLKSKLEESGIQCWMDIKRMGGGDPMFAKIVEGIGAAKVLICCVTKRYCKSEMCQREVTLADSLKKTVIPLLFEDIKWPPEGPMALIFTSLVYIKMTGGPTTLPDNKLHELVLQIQGHVAQ